MESSFDKGEKGCFTATDKMQLVLELEQLKKLEDSFTNSRDHARNFEYADSVPDFILQGFVTWNYFLVHKIYNYVCDNVSIV